MGDERCGDCIYRNDYTYQRLTGIESIEFEDTWCSMHNDFAMFSDFCDSFEWAGEEKFCEKGENYLRGLD